MESAPLFDCAGRRRSSATFPGHHQVATEAYSGVDLAPPFTR
jgi:hypothetical protein